IGVRKYLLLQKKYLFGGEDEKDEGGKGMMNNKEQKDWLLQKKFLRGLDEKDERGKGMMNNREQKEQRKKVKQKAAEEMSKMAETHMIVATLISTITFAAGFTIPGGYHGEQGPNQGMAVLVREAAFKAFVISNTIALICSTSSVFLYVSASLFNITGRGRGEKRAHRYEIAFWLILTAMVAMMLAFSTGAYAVLAHSLGLAIATCVIACSSFIVYAFELKKHFAEESLSSFWEEFREDPFDFCRSCFCK
ncbi:hypothetical protein C3L33_13101, partial [Rhododendron williamsianum]